MIVIVLEILMDSVTLCCSQCCGNCKNSTLIALGIDHTCKRSWAFVLPCWVGVILNAVAAFTDHAPVLLLWIGVWHLTALIALCPLAAWCGTRLEPWNNNDDYNTRINMWLDRRSTGLSSIDENDDEDSVV
jgi:hypothetical protein